MWKKLSTLQVINTRLRQILYIILLVFLFVLVGNSFEADSDTDKGLFGLLFSDWDTRRDKVMRSNKDTGSDAHMFDNFD